MKKLITPLLAAVALVAHADNYTLTSLAVTNSIPASTLVWHTNTIQPDVRDYRYVTLAAQYTGTDAGDTSDVVFCYNSAVGDTAVWLTTTNIFLRVKAAGTATVVASTNVAVSDVSWLRLAYMTNANGHGVNSVTNWYAIKGYPKD